MTECIGDRIKKVRKALNLTLEEFGKQMGFARSTLSNIENNVKNVTERMINTICSKYNVNEVWLRTGEGGDDNMFTKIDPDDRFSINLGKLSVTENKLAQNMINAIAEADPEKLAYIEEFMKKCLGL